MDEADEAIENTNLAEVVPLVSPRAIKAKLAVTPAVAAVVLRARRAIRDVIHGRDLRRLVVVVGPCSLHDPAAAMEYAERLARWARELQDDLVIVMRTYFEKPRTTVGWKGLINDPHLDGSCDVQTGLELARSLLLQINGLGLACGYEALDPVTPQFIADLLSWAAIGARTTESQTHRELASGLSMPVGFKNGMNGGLEVALNAMISARSPHAFLGINGEGMTSVIRTAGNPDRHVVLRGGGGKTNFGPAEIAAAANVVRDEGVVRPIMVDCSHDNSGKDHTRQGLVFRDVLDQVRRGESRIMGLLVESNLKPGKQAWKENAPLAYGVSITDACIGWEETEGLLHEAAEAVRHAAAAGATVGAATA